MNDENFEIDFVFNESEAKAATERIKKGIAQVGTTAEETAKRLVAGFDPALGILKQVQDETKKLKGYLKDAVSGDSINYLKKQLEELAAFEASLIKTSKTTKTSFNGLQNSINQISRELPAFTYSAQTGFMAISNNIPMLIDQLGSLKKANAELAANGQATTPVWKQLVGGLFSWGTALSLGVTLLTVYGKEIGNFIASLFKGAEAIDAAKERWRILNEAFASNSFKKAVVDVNELKINIDLAKQGLLDKEKVVKQYNEGVGKTTGFVSSLTQAEKELQANADNYVKMTLYKAAANLALEEAAKKSLAAEVTRRKKSEEFSSATEHFGSMEGINTATGEVDWNKRKAYEAKIDAERKARQDKAIKADQDAADAQIDIAKKFQADAAKIASTNNFNFFEDNKEDKTSTDKLENQFAAALKSREGVYEKLQALDNEYKRKSFSKDEEEKAALKQKFEDFRKIIEKENEKIAEWNKKHKKQIKILDIERVDDIEEKATTELTQKQGFAATNAELEKQKKAFADYEAFKTKTTEAEAQKRFNADLKGFKSYGELLQKQIDGINQTPAESQSRAQIDQLQFLNKELEAFAATEAKHFDELVLSLASYEQKRTVMVSQYEATRQKLVEKGRLNEVTVLDSIHNEALLKLDDENTKKLDAFKNLYKGIGDLSDTAANKVLADAQSILAKLIESGAISAQLAKEIADKLTDGKKALDDRLPKRLQVVGAELRNIAGLVGDVNFAEWLGATGDVLGNLAIMKEQINSISSGWGKMSTLDKLGAGAGLFGAGMGIVSTVNNLFAKAEQKRQEQAEYATNVQLKQYEAMNKALERQVALIGKLYDTDKVTAYSEAQKKAAENQALFLSQLQGRSLLTGDQAIDKYITANNTGYRFGNAQDRSVAAGIKDKYGSYDFAKASIEDLQRLLDGNKLDDATAKIVQNLIDAKNAAGDLGDALKVDLTRTNFDELRQGIIDAVTSGADDAADNLNNIFRKSLLAFLEDDPVLKTRIAKWYEDFAAAAENGLTASEIDKLRQEYQGLTSYADQKKKELEQLSGQSLTDAAASSSSSGSNTLKGDFKNLTEETGSVLAGRMAGVQLSLVDLAATSKQNGADMLTEIKQQTLLQMQIAAYTQRTADNTENLKDIKQGIKDLNSSVKSSSNTIKAMGG